MTEEARLLSQADNELDSYDAQVRLRALEFYAEKIERGELKCAVSATAHNTHMHSFFSYNCFGWSPSHLAVMSRLLGFSFAGIVDFDVLNGIDEFLHATKRLNLKPLCGIETRVFIPEYAELEINSPGEVGVAYHMGVGFKSSTVPASAQSFAKDLAFRAAKRTRVVTERVNAALKDVQLDFERDVLPLTPSGNPTERHLCTAYRMKAVSVLGSESAALQFWKTALNLKEEQFAKAQKSIADLEGFIRSILMKSGGPGYIKPDAESFPEISAMNAFVKECGAVPCQAWLNGFSGGEADPVKLLSFHKKKGSEAIAIIPDRNWNFADEQKKAASIKNLKAVMDAAKELGLPTIAGTELNTPGQKLADGFDTPELSPFTPQFLGGAELLWKRFYAN